MMHRNYKKEFQSHIRGRLTKDQRKTLMLSREADAVTAFAKLSIAEQTQVVRDLKAKGFVAQAEFLEKRIGE
jgi:hypothetical protein